jgi:hypothetical protein
MAIYSAGYLTTSYVRILVLALRIPLWRNEMPGREMVLPNSTF